MLDGRKVEISTKEGFDAVPADKYTVQIVDVNLKPQLKYQSTEEEEVLEYKFQILDENPMDGEGTTRGRFLWKKCRLSLNSKSHLGKLAAAVYGRDLTKQEAESFDPEAVIGKQINVMTEQVVSKKDPSVFFNNVISFSKTIKELEALPIERRETQVVEKKTSSVVPTTAPDAEAEEFVKGLETKNPQQGTLNETVDAEVEAAEMEAAALEAKAKAARARANASKK